MAARLFWMQVVQFDAYQNQSARNRIRLIELPAPRGTLYDRRGGVFAEDRVSYNLVLLPQEVQDRQELFSVLSEKLRISAASLQQIYRKNYRAPFVPVVLAANISKEQALGFEEQLFQMPGLFVQTRPVRYYPYAGAAAHLIGYLGEIDQEELDRLKPYGYKVRDLVGQSGIEKIFDLELRGQTGGTQIEVNHRGRMIRLLGHRSPARGKDLQLTLDASLQTKAASLLSGRRGSIVAMDPSTGEILAMVSQPAFDPNAFMDPKRKKEIREWLKQKEGPFFNRALGAYTPGSIFKVITASAALGKGKITPLTSFECEGVFRLGSGSFSCWNEQGHGLEALSDALAHSCNIYFFHAGLVLGGEPLAEECHRWGLGKQTEIGIEGEAPGLVPNRRWKWQTFHQPWYDGDTLNFSIGQGYLLITPLQAARMVAVLANGGKLVKPRLIKRIGLEEVAYSEGQTVIAAPRILKEIKEGLRRVIADPTGTGQLSFSNQIGIAGKTGTAENPQGAPHAWFIGFAPIEEPRIAFSIFLENGGSGGHSAAPLARQLAEYYIGTEKMPAGGGEDRIQ